MIKSKALRRRLTCESAANVLILESYAKSAATLRNILSLLLPQRDSIEQTMEAIAEANAEAKEIDDAVHIGGEIAVGANDGFDEDELQAELDGMIKESQEDEDMKALAEKQRSREDGSTGQDVDNMITEETMMAVLQTYLISYTYDINCINTCSLHIQCIFRSRI
ncbi:uncharacterized protein BT62DRAFT_1003757 [Guyanagaster necrorhizus]|uniref:Uncharacterized protein n=1 Tax=Guyanagaster necrorhizus TaxID=856835 RepID=A0A9P7VV80_9AGAR|nr:uncharacterized protein BT62DRAFT_1003757 [Guyanagaster necrorhizus MCA 3950]KAG7447973.1 hypothetical protein BT62DRAFT_1003757 [Guyanagaster necrorhizus MCA 3950]